MTRQFTVIDCEQKSPEWFAARLGRVTSSTADAMLSQPHSKKPGEESAGRRNLRIKLALERLTGRSLERNFTNGYMKDGTEREPEALAAYEAMTGTMLIRTGFCSHNSLMVGCSLDGSCDDFKGIVEIKSPIAATHYEYWRTGKVPTDYMRQVTHAMFVTGAEWCDWFSYQPDFPDDLQIKLVRVNRSDLDMSDYESKLLAFLEDVQNELQAVQTMRNLRGQLELAVKK